MTSVKTTPPARSPRMQRKLAQTRADLLAAARALIAETGAHDLRISDIAERADVSHGTFYSHFASKDAIVESILTTTISTLAHSIADAIETYADPAEQMSVAIRRIIRIAYDDPQLACVLINLNHVEQRFAAMIHEQAQAVVERGIDTGRFRVDDLPTTLTMAIGASLAVIIGIVDGRLDTTADITCAANLLHSVGLSRAVARRIANRPLV